MSETTRIHGNYTTTEESNDELLARLPPEIRAARDQINELTRAYEGKLSAICNPLNIIYHLSLTFGIHPDDVPAVAPAHSLH